ncbi:MAG: 3-hydroxyacyl-CoA dehydrogenase NAD-binding domain-containing protein [Myxococcota bacterium]|nr:3-hydroxyacyl-CoA dehydrogenase NAD-binding domain-containing protein [Myxococcota bacterium]
MSQHLRVDDLDTNGILTIWIDNPDSNVNILNQQLIPEFDALLNSVNSNSDCKGLVIASAKANCFVAGADITMLNTVQTAEGGAELASIGQKIMNALAAAPIPTVAAIHGDCLGGGLELALACNGRVASNAVRTKLALPEVMLGLLPGSGGTRRLPRLVGLAAALDMMLTGKNIRPQKALKMGLVDKVVPQNQLIEAAKLLVMDLQKGLHSKPKPKFSDRAKNIFLEGNPLGRGVIFREARKMIMKKTHGLYPAPLKIIEVLKADSDHAEATGFGELLITPESHGLRHLFHCITALKKDDGPNTEAVEPIPVTHVGMLGAGLMGGGIATVLVDKGLTVRLKDVAQSGLEHAYQYAQRYFDKALKRKRLNRAEHHARLVRLSGGLTYDGFAHADVVIEAVPENLSLKKAVIAELEDRSQAIIASNTSSLPISKIAEGSQRPDRVVGMHFFSPVEKMPLVEVIVTAETDPVVTKTVVGLGRTMGKHVIVVNDCAGFYTTRVLAPYMIEALFLLSEGYQIPDIDAAAQQLGFAVGPFTLMDEVGIDVGAKVTSIMKEYYSDHMDFPDLEATQKFIDEGRLGKKTSKGFYRYENGRSITKNGQKVVDADVYSHLPNDVGAQKASLSELGNRLLLALINEALRCFEEGVLRSAESGDLGAVFGIGFPPMKGGPFKAVDTIGAAYVLAQLQRLARTHGKRFKPASILVQYAESNTLFYASE